MYNAILRPQDFWLSLLIGAVIGIVAAAKYGLPRTNVGFVFLLILNLVPPFSGNTARIISIGDWPRVIAAPVIYGMLTCINAICIYRLANRPKPQSRPVQ